MANKSSGGSGNSGDDIVHRDICEKVERGRLCGLPLSNTMRVNGAGFIIIFRACQKKPRPHTTVEYFEL